MINLLTDTVHNVWPMLFIFTVIIVSIRITYLILNKERLVIHEELLMLCFIIYILLLYYFVTFQDNNYGTNNFIPFREIFRYKTISSLFIRNVLGNILLFIPFGFLISYYVKNRTVLPVIILSILVSCSIEFAQSVIGRTVDIDDVILNLTGGITGYIIYKVGSKITDKLPKFMHSQIFKDILSIFIILVIIYLAYKFNIWRIIAWTILKL